MGSNEWVAIGTLLTAAFTGFSAWWLIRHRQRPEFKPELASIKWGRIDDGFVKVAVSIRNIGNGPATGVRTFLTKPGRQDKQIGDTHPSVAGGEAATLIIGQPSTAGPQVLNEETGTYKIDKADFDPRDISVVITWHQSPKFQKLHRKEFPLSELRSEYFRLREPLE